MKQTLRVRLGLSFLAVILVGIGIAAPLAWLAVEGLYLDTQSNNLLAQAKMVAAALGSQDVAGKPAPYYQSFNVAAGIHSRVIDAQGGAVIDLMAPASTQSDLVLPELAQNAAGPVTPEELLSRPEIVQARQGQPATAVRSLDTAGGRRVLYAAAPVLASDGAVTQIVYLATPLPEMSLANLPDILKLQLAGVLLLAIVVAGGAGWLLARRINRPIADLVKAAQAVADGDLSQSVPESVNIRELDVLGRTFNRMIASLRHSDQARTAFISDVTHELRTPLTVIKGTIETLEDGAVDDREARTTFLASMGRETERLIRLVNDLLVLTRADAGALNLQLRPVDLAELARQRCAHLQGRASQRNVSLVVDAAAPSSEVNGYSVKADSDRMAQVLDNLLDNAIRYAPPGSAVTVSILRIGNEIVLRVTDCGPGIPAKHLPFIFERFYRADPGRDRSQGGAGLGLAIVRSLVEAQDGRVTVESTEGQGATFTVFLPALK